MAAQRTAPIIRFSRMMQPTGGCWNWTGPIGRSGYGIIGIPIEGGENRTKHISAHRFSYEHFVGPIPQGLQLDHLRRNRACVNPAHLEAVTRKENLLRGESFSGQNSRKTHCLQGHEFNKANTGIYLGHRSCRECKKLMSRRIRKAARENS